MPSNFINWSCKLTLCQREQDGGGGQPPVKSEVRAQSNKVGRLWFLGVDAQEYPGGLLRLDPAFAYAEPPSSWTLSWVECLSLAPRKYSCLENPHGQRSLGGNCPWCHKESDTTKRLSTAPRKNCPGLGMTFLCLRRILGHIPAQPPALSPTPTSAAQPTTAYWIVLASPSSLQKSRLRIFLASCFFHDWGCQI